MVAGVDALSSSAPLSAAPELPDYSQFVTCEIPPGSGALQAYAGIIRPFSDDQTAREVLRTVEAKIPIQVSAGRLHAEASPLRKHPFEDFLVAMAVPFTILILEFEGMEHPRAFLVNPRMQPRLSLNPHIRADKSILIEGRLLAALCVYSGNLFHYGAERSRMEQFLDQIATYLAKHLIWMRTRMLFRPLAYGMREFVYRRKPLEAVSEIDTILSPDVYWDGFWPGSTAPSGPAEHLATIKREDECWCWSGKRYGDCCRPKDLARDRLQR